MNSIAMSRQNGFAIIEALIAFLLLGIGVAALIYLQGNLMSGSSISKARAEAIELAKDRTEILRNNIHKEQYLSALSGVIQDDPVTGVNAEYIVCYDVIPTIPPTPTMDEVNDLLKNPVNLEVIVKWPGAEGVAVTCSAESSKDEKVSLETMLYFMSPVIVSAIDPGSDDGLEGGLPPLLAPWIAGKEGVDPSTAEIKNSNDSLEDDMTDVVDDSPLGITVTRYTATEGTLEGRSNVEVTYGLNPDGSDKVVLTSFGGIVHRIKGKIITDRFSVPLDADKDGELSEDELRNYWIDDGGPEGTGIAGNNTMEENEVRYWLDANSDGEIQLTEYTYWVDANVNGIVEVSEFDPPEATATASSTIEDLRVLGSPPSFCIFPICDDPLDTDNDCKVPVDPTLDDGTFEAPLNNDVDEYGIASYVCYVPGDCTYQDDYASGSLNGCPANFISPTDDDFDDLNGGWYGRIGNFGVKLNPDDMVCTADTTKTHLTPSREYVTYRCKVALDLVDGTCHDDDSDESNGNGNIIANEGINTPYSNQTFIIARKNNKPSVYCPIRALSYEGNLVNEQIKRELSGPKIFYTDGSPDDTTAWEKNIVLPENICITGLSCPPP